MIVLGMLLAVGLVVVMRRRRRQRRLTEGGLTAAKPQFMVEPPMRRMSERKGERL